MTKSTITRERLEEIVSDPMINQGSEFAMMARMALAAMDSEPHTDDELSNLLWYSQEATCHSDPNYYCEFQRLATPGLIAGIIRELQERRKADSEPVVYTDEAELCFVNDMACMWTKGMGINEVPLYRHAQPAPVVMDDTKLRELFDSWFASDCSFDLSPEASEADNIAWRESYWYVWKRCRATILAAARQSPGSEPATVPGKWIPVSEQMPPSRYEVLVGRWWGEKPRWCCKWATYIPGHPDAQSSGWLIPGASWTPTHWMPLPAAPQEVKSES